MTKALTIGISGGTHKTVTAIFGHHGGALREAKAGFVGVAGGGVQQFFSAVPPIPPLDAVATPESLGWSLVTSYYESSGDVSVNVSGGVAPYYYAWQSNNGSVSIDNVSAPSTGFESFDGTPAEVWCTVTDDAGTSVDTNHVNIS